MVAGWAVTPGELADLAARVAGAERIRSAVIVPLGVGTRLFRFCELHARPGTFRVFNRREEALAWLQEDPDEVALF